MTFTLPQLMDILKRGVLTYSELYEILLWRIYEYDQSLHAILNIDIDAESAGYMFDQNKKMEKPLFGIPFSVKDTIMTSTITTTAGSLDVMEVNIQAEIVTILRALGGYVISKTNCPEFSLDIQTFNKIQPPTRNPYNPSLTAGGSSGGSAVSVAMGFDIFSIGTDLNGSLRIPASFCHVCSYKPTEKLLPISGVIPPLKPTMRERYNLNVGIISRRIADIKYVTQHVFEYMGITQKNSQTSELKIAFTVSFPEVKTSNDIIQAMISLREYLVGMFEIISLDPKFDFKTLTRIQSILVNSFIHDDFEYLPHVDPTSRSNEEDIEWALNGKKKIKEYVDQLLSEVDIWILPVTPILPFQHNLSHSPLFIDGEYVNYWKATLPYCTPFSISGHPVITLPVKLIDGIPFGVQVVGKYGYDSALISIAEKLDSLMDNKQYPPLLEKSFAEY